MYLKSLKKSGRPEESENLADIGVTIAANYVIEMPEGPVGSPIKEKYLKRTPYKRFQQAFIWGFSLQSQAVQEKKNSRYNR